MKFCEILKELREEQQITRKELAIRSGLSPQCISALEKEQRLPTSSTLAALSDYFKVSSDYLLGREEGIETVPTSKNSYLTEQEETLLRYFRALPEELQSVALETVRVLAGAPAEKSLQKKA